MFVQKINPPNLHEYLNALGSESAGVKIMSAKGEQMFFQIHHLKTPAAQILKQDSLSVGADFALPRGAITHDSPYVDGILIANARELERIIQKCKIQPFGLQEVGIALQKHLSAKSFPLQIMGIINATEDSFFERSRFLGEAAIRRIGEMIKEGADIIDIGGASTRPGSEWVSEEEELRRVTPIADSLADSSLLKKARFSVDTYNARVAEYCLDRGFHIINDITALRDSRMLSLASERQCEVVIMHMQGESPRLMQQNPHYEHLLAEVDQFFCERIETLERANVRKLVLDVGIGFGKNLEHNLKLIRHLSHFKHFGFPLLLGASRKSMIDKISPASVQERLAGTLALHLEGYKAGGNIIRCHDVKEHVQAFKVLQALHGVGA